MKIRQIMVALETELDAQRKFINCDARLMNALTVAVNAIGHLEGIALREPESLCNLSVTTCATCGGGVMLDYECVVCGEFTDNAIKVIDSLEEQDAPVAKRKGLS